MHFISCRLSWKLQHSREIEVFCLPVISFMIPLKQVEPAYDFVKVSESHFSEIHSYIFSKESEKSDQILSFSHEPFSQIRILCCHSDRTCTVSYTHLRAHETDS